MPLQFREREKEREREKDREKIGDSVRRANKTELLTVATEYAKHAAHF